MFWGVWVAGWTRRGATYVAAGGWSGCGALVGGRGASRGRPGGVTVWQNAPEVGAGMYATLHWGAHMEHFSPGNTVRTSFEVLVHPV